MNDETSTHEQPQAEAEVETTDQEAPVAEVADAQEAASEEATAPEDEDLAAEPEDEVAQDDVPVEPEPASRPVPITPPAPTIGTEKPAHVERPEGAAPLPIIDGSRIRNPIGKRAGSKR